jgi:hypothetical protein
VKPSETDLTMVTSETGHQGQRAPCRPLGVLLQRFETELASAVG